MNLITPLLLCVFIGQWVDRVFRTRWILLFILLGMASGIWSTYKTFRKILLREEKRSRKAKQEEVFYNVSDETDELQEDCVDGSKHDRGKGFVWAVSLNETKKTKNTNRECVRVPKPKSRIYKDAEESNDQRAKECGD